MSREGDALQKSNERIQKQAIAAEKADEARKAGNKVEAINHEVKGNVK